MHLLRLISSNGTPNTIRIRDERMEKLTDNYSENYCQWRREIFALVEESRRVRLKRDYGLS